MVTFVYWTVMVLSIVMPVSALMIIASSAGRSRRKWLLRCTIGCLLLAFSFQTSVWAVYSIYLKYVFIALAIVAMVWSRMKPLKRIGSPSRVLLAFGIGTCLVLLLGNVMAFRGHYYPKDEAVDLQFPLRHGKFYIIQGGNSAISNFFHNRSRSQKYAVDIVKLNNRGVRAGGILPKALDRYYIYGDTIFSPCDGVVIAAADGRPESVPPTMKAEHPLGNGVIIDIGHNRIVVLAHMKPGSVMVSGGQHINTGKPLGLVGNSGRSAEPHLHIMAVNVSDGRKIFEADPLPMRFNKRFLTLNDVVVN